MSKCVNCDSEIEQVNLGIHVSKCIQCKRKFKTEFLKETVHCAITILENETAKVQQFNIQNPVLHALLKTYEKETLDNNKKDYNGHYPNSSLGCPDYTEKKSD